MSFNSFKIIPVVNAILCCSQGRILRHRMDNELYVIGNKQFLATCLNGILNMETERSLHPPHYLQKGTVFSNALETNKILEKVMLFSFKIDRFVNYVT